MPRSETQAALRAIEAALRAIEAAFEGVPPPGPDSLTLFQAEAADDYATCDRSRDHLGRWQDLPRDHLAACPCAMSYLDDTGLQFYAPAVMGHHLAWAADDGLPHLMIFDSLEFTLTPTGDDLRAWTAARLRRWTRAQRAATAAYLAAIDSPAAPAWSRAVDAAPWFDALWPDRVRPADDAVRAALLAAFPDRASPPPAGPLADLDPPTFLRALPARCLDALAGDAAAADDVAAALHPRFGTPERPAVIARLRDLSPPQRRALAAFLDARVERQTLREMWARAADDPADDWILRLAGR